MREYQTVQKEVCCLSRVICDGCGRTIGPHEDYLAIDKTWGYGSRKDGQATRLDLCEDCFDAWLANLPGKRSNP